MNRFLRSISKRTWHLVPTVAVATAFLASTGQASDCDVFEERDGMLVIEIENQPPTDDWVSETDHAGYTGSSYYRWDGPDNFNKPGEGILTFRFEIENPGDYNFRIHNRHEHPDSSEANDVWARLDGGKWVKTYSNAGKKSVGAWVWYTSFEHSHSNHEKAHYVLSKGQHTLQISGRSHDMMIDRLHLYLDGHDGESTSHPQSTCTGDSPYCVAKENSAGCVPSIQSFDGPPSMTGPTPFRLVADDVINNKLGILLYSFEQNDVPFYGGNLCIGADIRRTSSQFSGGNQGTTDCSGSLDFDFNGYAQSGADPDIQAGRDVFAQYWYRDPGASFNVGLTDAFKFTVQP